MPSLYTAASGMKTQQMYIDTISNNLSNVNSTGFKKERIEFKSLFYETVSQGNTNESGEGSPVGIQIGRGVKTVATTKDFTQGNIESTENALDFSIIGNGFFVAQDINGDYVYTKAGNFKLSVNDDDDTIDLTTSEGYKVLNTDLEPIQFDDTFLSDNLQVDESGQMTYLNGDGETDDLDMQMAIVQFKNPAGLTAVGRCYYMETSASGEPLLESEEDDLISSTVNQGSIENSNVEVVDEMVNMIVAQRSYELNSKAITTSDDMLSIANNLMG
jgi:flagellar basal-body rod protein FlgG